MTASQVDDDAYLLDVREPDEWAAGHAPGAHHVPMMEIPARMAEIPTDQDVVVVCRSGGRSGQVVSYLTGNGRGRETLTAQSRAMFAAVRQDRLVEFIARHPAVVADAS